MDPADEVIMKNGICFGLLVAITACTPQIADKTACETQADCIDGYKCVDAICVPTPAAGACESQADCIDGYKCVDKVCVPAPAPCIPKTCEKLRAECGAIADGCGATLDCGDTCQAPKTCGGDGAPNRCGFVGDGWSLETVDEKPAYAIVPSLAINAHDTPFIAYLGVDRHIFLAERDRSGWVSASISFADASVGQPSCAVDPEGRPYVAHAESSGAIFHHFSGSEWVGALASANESFGFGSAIDLVFDGAGNPHLCSAISSAADGKTPTLNYSHYTEAQGWGEEVVLAGDSLVIRGCDLAVGVDGSVHVVFGDFEADTLSYALRTQGSWSIQSILPGQAEHSHYSMALDGSGAPVVGFHHSADSTVRVARLRDGAWSAEIVDTVASYAAFLSIAVDADDGVHLSYYHPEDAGMLRYASNAGGSWRTESVAVGGPLLVKAWENNTSWEPSGGYNALALDSTGKPRIAFYDSATRLLRYAMKE